MDKNSSPYQIDTDLCHLDKDRSESAGFLNPPIYRGSTTLFPTAEDLRAGKARYTYGMPDTPTSDRLVTLIKALEDAEEAIITPSGLASISLLLMGFLNQGEHILVTDSVYDPTRRFLEQEGKRWGLETTYYDPLIGASIEKLISPNTRMIFLESPGSQTMEIQDVPAIVSVAKKHNIMTAIDNTWATPLYFPAHHLGVDFSIHAATKYFGGHSDILLGTLSAINGHGSRLKKIQKHFGFNSSAEEISLCLRGLRSLGVRLKSISSSALTIAKWLAAQPGVRQVLHPALPSHPQHDLWKRDFKGASGLFTIILDPVSESAVNAFLNNLKWFGLGYSWGGYESLIIPFDPQAYRTATTWSPGGPALRLSIGLEDTQDLINDLAQSFHLLKP